ncbi:conserved protein of unknown function (plasmid) [Rhodovastum atsumiense]|uniref:Uncharacterized protein n=1 Tax=Rhodovastum atsumiense TaxID=504468 RepID=A0A5M6IU88_9PROT|nr:hypothetical protein [Rhodovastum atsumiense]KAA5611844.1 hypothetical protein F1189_12470 [Rhodovastum atsumiense]CAH2606185.1 conserved protein of unknown function [Rhodovastum atsumiense]
MSHVNIHDIRDAVAALVEGSRGQMSGPYTAFVSPEVHAAVLEAYPDGVVRLTDGTAVQVREVAPFADDAEEAEDGDWADAAAADILDELSTRRGIGDELGLVDDDVLEEIRDSIATIIRDAAEAAKAAP